MTYEEFDKRCDELENAPLQERKTFFADVLAGETEKTDVRMMAFFRYALLFYRGGNFLAAREILEPFIIDYKSYRYRPEIIACFNLVGVVAYYVQEYALSRFYIREGLKIAREHSEVSRYAYEYNNLAVTYLAQQDYEKALEVIRDCRSDEARVDDCLGKIDISAKHLLSLVNDVLDMSKIESNSFVVEAKPFNLARTLVEVDDIVRIQAEQSGLQLYTDHDDVPDADLLGSALYLKKILVNLYSNAIKYNKPGGSITTRLREVSRTADTAVYAFTIRDTGIGMTQDFIDNHLFEAFSQEDNAARSQYGGTGLGMSIVSQLVQKMNGTITVESTVGEGSSFTVTLPFAIDHDPPAAGPEKEASTDLHGKRLLVVEDNELNMEIAEFMLKSAGAEVVKAFDGESAVRAFAADPAGCDAILMDLMMPVMDGYAAARAIRASGQPRAGTVPIIAMSANAYAEDVKKCLDSGMNAHISKPLFKDVMLRTIARFV